MESTHSILLKAAELLDKTETAEGKLRAQQLRQIANEDYSTGTEGGR